MNLGNDSENYTKVWPRSCPYQYADTERLSAGINDCEAPMAMNPKRDEQPTISTHEAGKAALWTMMEQTLPKSDLSQHDYVAPIKGTPAAKRSIPAALEGPERDRLLIEHLSSSTI